MNISPTDGNVLDGERPPSHLAGPGRFTDPPWLLALAHSLGGHGPHGQGPGARLRPQGTPWTPQAQVSGRLLWNTVRAATSR